MGRGAQNMPEVLISLQVDSFRDSKHFAFTPLPSLYFPAAAISLPQGPSNKLSKTLALVAYFFYCYCSSSRSCTSVAYYEISKYPQRNKSRGFKSGDFAGYDIDPLLLQTLQAPKSFVKIYL